MPFHVPPKTRLPVFLIVIVSMFFITAADATGKLATETYSIWQVLWVRSWVWLLFAFAWFRSYREVRTALTSTHAVFHTLRSVILVAEIAVMIVSFKLLPLGDVTSIIAATPLVVLGLSALFLHERAGRLQLVAVALGFLGVLLVAKPGLGVFGFTTLVPMAGVLLWALYQVFQKRIGTLDDERTSLLWTALVMFLLLGLIGPWFWVTPVSLPDLAIMVLAGLFNVMGHFGLMIALRRACASEIQPFTYTTVLWAMGLGFAIFGEIPGLLSCAGLVTVVGAGLLSTKTRLRLPRFTNRPRTTAGAKLYRA